MEFLELLLLFIAILIIFIKPERENIAFGVFVVSWLLMIISYVGHISSNILPVMNY